LRSGSQHYQLAEQAEPKHTLSSGL
jgi:hypothetical protein